MSQDIYLSTVYLSSEKTNDNNKRITSRISKEAISLKEKGIVLIQVDFNTHTSNMADYLVSGKSDEPFAIVNCDKHPLRNSEDKKPLNKTIS